MEFLMDKSFQRRSSSTPCDSNLDSEALLEKIVSDVPILVPRDVDSFLLKEQPLD
jgi:hypothetical protein